MSTLCRHRLDQSYLPAHHLRPQPLWLGRPLWHIDGHHVVEAAARGLPAARLQLGRVPPPLPNTPFRWAVAAAPARQGPNASAGPGVPAMGSVAAARGGNQRCPPPGGRPQQALCTARPPTQNSVKISAKEQAPPARAVRRRGRAPTSCHLQRTRWGASKGAQATMWGLLCPPPICTQHLWRPQPPPTRPAATDPVGASAAVGRRPCVGACTPLWAPHRAGPFRPTWGGPWSQWEGIPDHDPKIRLCLTHRGGSLTSP